MAQRFILKDMDGELQRIVGVLSKATELMCILTATAKQFNLADKQRL
jgi:hypothetical protein